MKQTALQATAIRLPNTILREQTADAPYWLEHIHQEPDGKVTSDLLPGMTWHPEAGVWVSFSEPSFTLMMPPTQAGIDAQHKEDTERFKKYLKEVRQE